MRREYAGGRRRTATRELQDVRAGADDAALVAMIRGTWSARADRYSELRTAGGSGAPKVEMSAIGG